MKNKKKVVVLFGGRSTEHEVSRASARSVLENINRDKYEIEMIGITRDGKWLRYNGELSKISTGKWEREAVGNSPFLLESKTLVPGGGKNPIDVVFPVLHGRHGEDGSVQGFLELVGVPYVGSSVLGSALAMDKGYAKIIFDREGLPQGRYEIINKWDFQTDPLRFYKRVEERILFPCFIKPCNSGSSVGVNMVTDRGSLEEAIGEAFLFDSRILAEQYMAGREIECSVLGNNEPVASCPGEIIPDRLFYDYESKYSRDSKTQIRVPAQIDEKSEIIIKEYSIRAFKALNCSGLARVDFFLDKDTEMVYINEINTMPGFTPISMYPKLWEASGMSYGDLIDRLIDLAIERHKEKNELVKNYTRLKEGT